MLFVFSVKEEFLMGRGKQEQPRRLAEKLRQIRRSFEMTQEDMARKLESQNLKVYRGYVGLYEIGERIPSVLIIMAYARIAGVTMEILCDDKLELPESFQDKNIGNLSS